MTILGEEPCVERFDKPTNPSSMLNKPDGGLWTSTMRNGSSDWLDWCLTEKFWSVDNPRAYLLEPADDIELIEINTGDDLDAVLEQYKRSNLSRPDSRMFAALDFEAIATEYDGIHLTDRGMRSTHMRDPGLYGWDCESTVFLDWVFDATHPLPDML